MSGKPTVFEGGTGRPTRREGDPGGARPTRYEQVPDGSEAAASRRENQPAAGPGSTRREDGPATRVGTRYLPPVVAARYSHVRDLPTAGAEADLAVLRDRQTERQVVLKFYRTGLAPDLLALEKLAGADPRFVVELIEYASDADGTWEILEYCKEGSLADWVARQGGRLDKRTLKAVLVEITEALEYLHDPERGIAHRDLKPANVLVRSAEGPDLVLADFGLAKAQQGLSRVTSTVKGSWHYAAPEVSSGHSTTRSDWFALGAMIYEFYTGRPLFSMVDGTPVSDTEARARCGDGDYSTELVDDPHWRLLCDGLLTHERDDRWGADEVTRWLCGDPPEVAAPKRRTPAQRADAYDPDWTPALISTPEELAEQIRLYWDGAATKLSGRPDAGMVQFLEGCGLADAVRVLSLNEPPGAKLVRLQGVLDPGGPIAYDGVSLDEKSLASQIRAGAAGDERALDWLAAVRDERILSAYAAATDYQQAADANYRLGVWRGQADALSGPLPSAYQAIAREAFRTALPELFAAALSGSGSDPRRTTLRSEVEKLAGDDLGNQGWVARVVGAVRTASDDDRGTLVVARGLLGAVLRERAEEADRQQTALEQRRRDAADDLARRRARARRARRSERGTRLCGQLGTRIGLSLGYAAAVGGLQVAAGRSFWPAAIPVLVVCLLAVAASVVFDWFAYSDTSPLRSRDPSGGIRAIVVWAGLLYSVPQWIARWRAGYLMPAGESIRVGSFQTTWGVATLPLLLAACWMIGGLIAIAIGTGSDAQFSRQFSRVQRYLLPLACLGVISAVSVSLVLGFGSGWLVQAFGRPSVLPQWSLIGTADRLIAFGMSALLLNAAARPLSGRAAWLGWVAALGGSLVGLATIFTNPVHLVTCVLDWAIRLIP